MPLSVHATVCLPFAASAATETARPRLNPCLEHTGRDSASTLGLIEVAEKKLAEAAMAHEAAGTGFPSGILAAVAARRLRFRGRRRRPLLAAFRHHLYPRNLS